MKASTLVLASLALLSGSIRSSATPPSGGSDTSAVRACPGGDGFYSVGSFGKTTPIFGGGSFDGGSDNASYDGPWIGPAEPIFPDPGTISQGKNDIRTWFSTMWNTPGAFRDWARETIEYGVSWTPYGTVNDFLQGGAEIYWANQDLNDGRISKDEYDRRVSEGLTAPLPGSSDLKYWFGTSYPELLNPIVEGLTPTIPPPQEIGTTEKWFESHPLPSGPAYIGPAPDDNQTFIGPADPPTQYQDFADPGATQWYGW